MVCALVLIDKNRAGEAIPHLEKTIELNPDWPEPLYHLALVLAENKNTTFHNPKQAIRLAEQACKLVDYKQPKFLDALAIAYAADGRLPQAVETAQKAFNLAQAAGDADLTNKIRQHIQLYQSAISGNK